MLNLVEWETFDENFEAVIKRSLRVTASRNMLENKWRLQFVEESIDASLSSATISQPNTTQASALLPGYHASLRQAFHKLRSQSTDGLLP